MDREKLFRQLDQRYASRREMISCIPLGVQPDALWQELLNQRRSKSTVLPLYNPRGQSYWYVTTDKMVRASEKIVETLFETETDFDPYADSLTVSNLEEAFYTSYVEGAQITIQEAMEFLSGGQPPRIIEEQMIANNRLAGSYAGRQLYRTIDAQYLKELVQYLTDGLEQGGPEYRTTDFTDMTLINNETFEFPAPATIPDRIHELSAFLETETHPLIKAAVAQACMMLLRPFPEGNERLGRLLSSIILLRAGYTFLSEISLSALIARKSYGYYEAMANILREENGGDLTYFIEYFLDLLSRAVDERRLRLKQHEEKSRQTEQALAHTALTPSQPSTPQNDSQSPPPPTPEDSFPDASPDILPDMSGFAVVSVAESPEDSPDDDPSSDGSEKPVYGSTVLERIKMLTDSNSPKDRRIGSMLLECMKKGEITIMDYLAEDEETKWQTDMYLASQMGLVKKIDPNRYKIMKRIRPGPPLLTKGQRKFITEAYEIFGDETFSLEMAVATLDYAGSHISATLHKFTLLKILDCKKDGVNQYQFLITPEEHPECFDIAA